MKFGPSVMWNEHFISVFIRSFVVVKTANANPNIIGLFGRSPCSSFNLISFYIQRFFFHSSNLKNLKTHSKCNENLQNTHTRTHSRTHTQTSSHTTNSVEVFLSVKNSHTLKLPSSKVMHAILSRCHCCETKHNNSILHVDCMGLCGVAGRCIQHSAF